MNYCQGYTDEDGIWQNGFPCLRGQVCCTTDRVHRCCDPSVPAPVPAPAPGLKSTLLSTPAPAVEPATVPPAQWAWTTFASYSLSEQYNASGASSMTLAPGRGGAVGGEGTGGGAGGPKDAVVVIQEGLYLSVGTVVFIVSVVCSLLLVWALLAGLVCFGRRRACFTLARSRSASTPDWNAEQAKSAPHAVPRSGREFAREPNANPNPSCTSFSGVGLHMHASASPAAADAVALHTPSTPSLARDARTFKYSALDAPSAAVLCGTPGTGRLVGSSIAAPSSYEQHQPGQPLPPCPQHSLVLPYETVPITCALSVVPTNPPFLPPRSASGLPYIGPSYPSRMCAGLERSFAGCTLEPRIDPVYSLPPAVSPDSEFTLSVSLPPPSLCEQMVASRATQTPRRLDSLELELGIPGGADGTGDVGGLSVGGTLCLTAAAGATGTASEFGNIQSQSVLHASMTQSPHSHSTETPTPVPSSSRSAAGDTLTPSLSASSFSFAAAASTLPASAAVAAAGAPPAASPHSHRVWLVHQHQAHTLQHPQRRACATIAPAPAAERSPLATSSSQPQQLGLFAARPPARTLSEHAHSWIERRQQQQRTSLLSHAKVSSYLESLDHMLPDPNELELDERSPSGREDDYERLTEAGAENFNTIVWIPPSNPQRRVPFVHS